MGPRLFSRGEVPEYTFWAHAALFLLQWGRGCSAAESGDDCGAAGPKRHASMGPRLFSRGEAARYRAR